ncbi:unnamed protein product [Cylicocyclus nassatus]|uniref:DUF7758 domain-containing protein n=1 Tax=Cylicocyclus nassatus TaxID=53992 RepID=A0AA36HH04_CYLNA|nr:unnamed protein product [Cylicocyclus nassatus]
MSEREKAFESARTLGEAGKIDEALEALTNYTSEPETEYTVSEMEVINTIITEKLTSVSFEEKKDACNVCITLLEGIKLVKDGAWLSLYSESVYEAFSRMSICARDEERQLFWNRLKELFYEINLAAKKVWRDKNYPERLAIYVLYAKLCKSWLDVADEESYKLCETEAKEAKFFGKGTLDDDQWRESNRSIEQIKKLIGDALHERELIDDESD